MASYPLFEAQEDGYSEWCRPPVDQPFRMQCCDCGLVHNLEFRFIEGQVEFRAGRNNRATGQIRRHRGISLKTVEA